MADSLIYDLIYDLCKAAGKELLKKASLLHGVPEEATKIQENFENIKAVLPDAEQREMDPSVKRWLSELRNVAYDIEDVLEDYSIADSRYVWTKQLKSHYNIAQRIKSINEKLGEIDERKNRFNFLTSINSINERPKLEAAPAYGDYTVVRSHEEVKAKVIQMLVHGDSKGNVANGNHIPIISLVGMGGIGKTTLAQLVYNDGSVKGHFSKTIWVSVLKPFNEMNVAKAIAEDLNLDSRNDSTKQNVLSKIDGSIKGLKFLLVLDDVWEDSKGKWGGILRCLGKGNTQSRILLTTRNSELSEKMGADIVSVEGLPVGDAWSLFSYYAFPGESGHRKEVKDIAERLAEKCRGLPLALKVLGIHMASKKTRTEWDNVLTSELWKTEFEESVFYSLAVSYLELPSAAKTCFAFCSIFPKDTVMTKNNLIRLWMAQGYLRGEKGDQMEDLGEVCFQSLESRSFFRVREIGYAKFADKEVTMHDLVHDFARYISNGEVAILDPSLKIHGGGIISKNLRHLAISGKARESKCPQSNALRTLFLSTDSTALLEAVCSNISYVRALDIQIYFKAAERPSVDYHFKDIGKLKHLRYLGLRTNISTVLPKGICELPYLQTLHIKSLSTIKTFPNKIGRLKSLRHLLFDVRDCSLPKGLGKLSSLQTLSFFPCSALDSDGCSIEDLRDLNNLRVELRLKKLNNVANVDEATRAELHMKIKIRKLSLEFGEGDASFQSDVLEALQPAEGNLEFLEIKKHSGRRCPRWIGKMLYLKEVLLEDVSMESLPEMGMLRFLEKLYICKAYEVKHVGTEFFGTVEPDKGFFPKLTDLKFAVMSRWERWEGPDVRPRNGVRVTIMPSLRCLSIDDCDALQTLPRFLEHVPLECLELSDKSWPLVEAAEIDYPNRWRVGDILLPRTINHIISPSLTLSRAELMLRKPAVPRNIVGMTYLRKIEVENIEDDSLPTFGLLPSLLELTIRDAHNVGKVGDEFLGVSSNNTTAAIIVVFPRLEKLTFQKLSVWRKWEDPVHRGNINLAIMPSLRCLSIDDCDALQTLPRFLEHVPLESLELSGKSLLLVEAAEIDYPNRWQIGDILLPQTIKHIQSPYLRLRIPESEVSVPGLIDGNTMPMTAVPRYIIDLTYLRVIYLSNIMDDSLPPFGSLPSLLELNIWDAHNVGRVGDEFLGISSNNTTVFPRLEKLTFGNMVVWQKWDDPVDGGNINLSIMPSLCYLQIFECKILESLPHFFDSVPLRKLYVMGNEEGNMVRIRESSGMDEDTDSKTVSQHSTEQVQKNMLIVVLKLSIHDEKDKQKALKAVSSLTGIDSLSVDMKESKLTVVGDVDPVEVVRKLRKQWQATIVTVGPAKEEKKDDKKEGGDDKKKPELREITLSGVKNDWVGDWGKYCFGLRKLSLQRCGESSAWGLEDFPFLYILEISSGDIRHIRLHSSIHDFQLDISLMDDLDDIRDIWPNVLFLDRLSIRGCPKLKALPSFIRSVRLQELQIAGCPGLKTWWINEAGEDWHNWKSRIPRFNFPDLETEDESL